MLRHFLAHLLLVPALLTAALAVSPPPARAADPEATTRRLEELLRANERRMRALEKKVDALCEEVRRLRGAEARKKAAANALYVPLAPGDYGKLFERVMDVVDDYFEIAYANRYDGRIETFPKIAPGLEQPWKLDTPDWVRRALATLQTVRYRGMVEVRPADEGGFWVEVKVFKEREDLPRPACHPRDADVDSSSEVADPITYESAWIPAGREIAMEREILRRLSLMKVRHHKLTEPPSSPKSSATSSEGE